MPNRTIATVLALTLAAAWAPGAETAKDAPNAPAAQIARWIAELDAEAFKVREGATQRLIGAGEDAITPLTTAAKGESPEVTSRAIRVLKTLAQSEDAKLKSAALAALDKLAADQKHESGQLARDVLAEIRPPVRGRHTHIHVVGGNIQLIGRAQPVAVAAKPVGKRSVSVKKDGKDIRITEDAKEVVVTVTEKAKDGNKPKVTVYKAASGKDLKKKHPDAHKLYKEHLGKNKGNAAPVQVPPPRLNLRVATTLVDQARAELAAAIKALRAAKDGKPTAEDIARHLKQIEAAGKKLAEARRNLGR